MFLDFKKKINLLKECLLTPTCPGGIDCDGMGIQ